MMEENNKIFVAGGDALVYLAEPMHKKYSTAFVWDHPLSTYISYERFFNPLPLYAPAHILNEPPLAPPPPHSSSCVRAQWMAYFSTKKQIKTFDYRIHYNINIRKKNSLRKNTRYCRMK